MSERVVVVGGNAAGLTAASRAKRVDPSLSILVLEAGARIAYSICGLPFCLGGRVARIDDLVIFTPERLANERGIEARLLHRAIEIQPARRRVIVEMLESGAREPIAYDKLLVATGYRPRRLSVEGADLRGVFTASRLADGEAIVSWLESRRCRRAVLVGGGYVGLEMAQALVERGLEVTVVESEGQLLPVLDPEMARLVEEALVRRGLGVLVGRRVKRLAGRADGSVDAVELETGSLRLPADVVFVDVGVAPEVDLAVRAGAALGPTGAIAVDEHQRTGLSAVYAAGNCAETRHLVSGRPVLLPLGTVAAKQGRVAGENLAGRRSRFPGALGTAAVQLFDVAAARTGLGAAEAARAGLSIVEATIEAKFQAHYFEGGAPATVKVLAERGSGRLVGAQIVGSPEGASRIDVLAAAITAEMTVEEASQLDLAYAPPLGALWSPILVAMNALSREL